MSYLQMGRLMFDLEGARVDDVSGRGGVVVGRDPARGGQALPDDLAGLDELLCDPGLLAPIGVRWERLLAETGASSGRGRPTIAMETYVRLMIVKHRSGWGYETLMREVSDSLHLRRFCRIGMTERVPDESTVRKLTRRLGAEVVHEITRELIWKARREKRFRPRAARIDSTVVEADMKYPTDAGLADGGVRALAREGRKLAVKVGEKRTAVRDRLRAMGRKLRALTRSIRRRSGEAKAEVLALTAQTGKLLEQTIGEARKLAATARRRARGRGARAKLRAARKLEELADRCEKVTEQINKRVNGEKITDWLISLWDPDARPIRKGKLGKPNEFGYVDQLCEITANTKEGARGFVLPPQSQIGNLAEDTLLPDTAHELRNLGIKLKEIMVDGAFTTTATNNALEDLADTVHIAGPPRGRLAAHPPPPTTLPHRDGGTGQSPQTRRYGLGRSRLQGNEGHRIWDGWATLTYNAATYTTVR